MNINYPSLLISLLLLFYPHVSATAAEWYYKNPEISSMVYGQCIQDAGDHIFHATTSGTIPSNQNTEDSIISNITSYEANSSVIGDVLCRCGTSGLVTNRSAFFKAQVLYPSITHEGETYIKLNEYIAIKLMINVESDGGASSSYRNIFDMRSSYIENELTPGGVSRCTPLAQTAQNTMIWFPILADKVKTGSFGDLDLLILRPITDNIQFSGPIANIYMTIGATGEGPELNFAEVDARNPIWAQINLDIGIDAESFTCTPDSPSYTVDFGELTANQFTTIGSVPNGLSPKALDITVHCDFKATNALSMGLIATPSVGVSNAIDAGNNVGVIVQQPSSSTILSPTTQNEVDQNAYRNTANTQPHEYTFNLEAYPTKTSSDVEYGPFEAKAIIQLSFN